MLDNYLLTFNDWFCLSLSAGVHQSIPVYTQSWSVAHCGHVGCGPIYGQDEAYCIVNDPSGGPYQKINSP